MKLDRDLRHTEHKYLIWNFTKTLGLTPLTWHMQDLKMTTNFMRTSDFTSPLKDWLPSGKDRVRSWFFISSGGNLAFGSYFIIVTESQHSCIEFGGKQNLFLKALLGIHCKNQLSQAYLTYEVNSKANDSNLIEAY